MSKQGRDVILQAAAKALAWDVYAVGAYGRTRARVDVKRFDFQLRSAVRQWSATHTNLNRRKEQQR